MIKFENKKMKKKLCNFWDFVLSPIPKKQKLEKSLKLYQNAIILKYGNVAAKQWKRY